MKRILILFACLLLFAGCKKSSFVSKFEEDPEIRIGKAIANVKNILSSAENGWIVTTPTGDGGGFSFFMKFDSTENVKMYADLNDATASTEFASYYRIKQDQGIDLVFDTYTYIAMLNDPDPLSFGGTRKTGFKSDVDFIYNRSTEDSIVFTGKRYRQPLKMIKATAAQRAVYESGGLKTAIDKIKNFFATARNPYFEIPGGNTGIKVGIAANTASTLASGKRITFGSPSPGNFFSDFSVEKFAFTLDGASILNNGLVINGIAFVKLAWKDDTTLAVYDNTGKEYIVKESNTAVAYTSVIVSDAKEEPGWGSDFITRNTQVRDFFLSNYNIRLGTFTFKFTQDVNKMDLGVAVYLGTYSYGDVLYPYTYVKNANGTYKFSAGTLDKNANDLADGMKPIVAERISTDTFTLGYYTNPTTGEIMGQLKSVEHPDFTFTGALQ